MQPSVTETASATLEASIARWRAAGAPKFLGEVALHDQRLAGTLLKASRLGERGLYRYTDGRIISAATAWEIFSLKARWDSTTADQVLQAVILGTIETDLWIRRVTYTVRRPRFAKGSIWKAQSDYFNRLNPNIDVNQFIIKGFCNYFISPEATPLENIEAVFECVCPAGLVLTCDATIKAFFQNVRELEQDEVPTEAIISLHGTRLPRGLYSSCDFSDLVAELVSAGVFQSKDVGPGCP